MAKQKLALVESAKKKNKKEKTSSLASVAKTVTQATASAAKGKVVTPNKTTTPRKEIRSTGNVSNSMPMKRATSSNFTDKSTIKTNDLVSKKSWYNKDKNQSGTMTKKADIYKRGNKYYFDKDGEETEVSKDLINRAKKGQKIIGHYEDDGSYTYIDDRKKDKNLLHKAKYVGKSAAVGGATGLTGIADAGLQEAEESLKEGKKKKSTMDKIAQVAEIFSTIQNPQQGIVKGVKSHLKNLKGIWKDKDKSTKDKIVESAVSGVSSAKHAMPGYDQAKETLELAGSVFNNADEKVKKARETIDKPIQKMQQNLQEEGELYDGATKFVGQGLNIVGNMAPSIAATAITRNPNVGLATMGISAKGNATKEAMQQGASLEDAIKIGDAKGALEVGTEKLSGGAKLFGKGNLDDVIEETIKKKVGNKAMRKALLVGEGIFGEQAEELVSDVVGWQIDKGTFNPDAKYDLDDIKNTLAQTGFTTLLLNGITGGFTPKLNNNHNQNNVNVAKDLQAKTTQSAEIEQKVQNGEITPVEGAELIKQVQDGTYEKNQNLQAIANNAKQTIVQRLNSGEISQEQATQEMNSITSALAKQQAEINNNVEDLSKMEYNNITNTEEGVDNDFRRIQEESRGLSKEQHDLLYEGDKSGIKGVRENISRVLQSRMENIVRSNNDSGKPLKNGFTEVSNTDFEEIFKVNHPYLRNPDTVTPYGADEYKNNKNYLSDDGLSGFSITQSGDLISVFNNSGKPGMLMKIRDTVKSEAKTLDCFSSKAQDLPSLYADAFGFKTASIMDFNYDIMAEEHGKEYADAFVEKYGEAPVYFMVKTGKNITPKYFNKDQYEEAMGYRDSFVESEETGDSSFNNETQQNDDTTPKVLDKVPQKEQKKRTLREEFQWAKRKFVDKGEAVYRLAKERKNKSLYHKFDRMGVSEGESQSQIGIAQTDLNGKKYTNFINKKGKPTSMSVDGLFNDFKGPKDVLNQYLVHQLNLDRLGQGIEQFQNITGESSAEFIKKAEAEYPDIKRVAQNIYQYNYNQLDKMVDAGLITKAQADEFKTKTPHYVRIQRHILKNGKPVQETQYNVSLNNQIQKVEGSAADIMPIKETMAQYTKDVTQAIRRNIFANELANTLETETNSNEVALGEDMEINPNLLNEDGKGNYTFTYFKDGQAKTVPVDKAIFESLKPNEKYEWENYGVPRLMGKVSSIQRTLLTDKNPLFLATNFFKDIGDAPLNSKYGMAQFYKNYVRAVKDQASIGKFTQLYRSLGGNQNTYFEQGKFTEFSGNKVKRAGQTALHSIEKANNYIEQLPRITEFMTTIEQNGYTINENGDLVARNGKSPKKSVDAVLNEAMYNAAEITTNFKRGGNYAKALNRNGATFFNASVQGFSKQIRNFTEIDSPRAATRLMAKAVILGIGPEILNQAMHGGDDDYEELSDYIKDGYYLFKSKDGKWIRIPKGRAVSIFLSATRRTGETIRGEKNITEAFKGFGGFASNQIAPNNVAESNVLSPIIGAATNKSWSGNKIVPDSLANRKVSEQYNEKTDEFSKWIGKQLNISPMKVNYILDQYSGVIGDIGLPLITPKSKTGTKNPVKSAIISKFTADSVNDNKSVSVFFDTKNKIEGGIDSANQMSKQALQEKYMRTKNGEMAELYTKQREIQSNPNLSAKEKFEQAREIQKDINSIAKEAVKDVNNIDKKDNYAEIGDSIYYKASKDGKNYWKKESDKTKAKRDELGLPISDFYYYKIEEAYTKPNGSRVDITSGKHAKEDISLVKAFDMDTSDYLKYSSEIGSIRGDKRSNGATIRGSAKRKKTEYINSLPISATQKYLLYSLKVDQRKRKRTNKSVIDTINNSNLSRSEKQELYNYIYKQRA